MNVQITVGYLYIIADTTFLQMIETCKTEAEKPHDVNHAVFNFISESIPRHAAVFRVFIFSVDEMTTLSSSTRFGDRGGRCFRVGV
jgi:hypothetical protein